MANNFVNRGEVLTLTASNPITAGNPYREHGFNGVALIDAAEGEAYTLQVRGVFEFALADVIRGDLIVLNENNELTLEAEGHPLYGRAVTGTDTDGNFHCMILQSE